MKKLIVITTATLLASTALGQSISELRFNFAREAGIAVGAAGACDEYTTDADHMTEVATILSLSADALLGEYLPPFSQGKQIFDQALEANGQEQACEIAWELLGPDSQLKFLVEGPSDETGAAKYIELKSLPKVSIATVKYSSPSPPLPQPSLDRKFRDLISLRLAVEGKANEHHPLCHLLPDLV